jgi:type IV pilus assembly protein PilC
MTVNSEYMAQAIREDSQRGGVRTLMYLFVWVPAALFVLGLGSCFVGVFTGPVGLFFGPLATVFIIFAVRRNQVVWRERQAMTVLSYVENAVRLNLPLDEMLFAAEQSEHGATRLMLMRVRQVLLRGMPVSVALETGAPEIPERMLRAITAGEQIGQLQPTLTRLVRTAYRNRPTQGDDSQPFYRFYLVFVLFGLMLVGFGLLVFVIPKFRDIFKDFHQNLPPLTAWFVNRSSELGDSGLGAVLIIAFLLVFVFWVARKLQHILTPAVPSLIPSTWRDRIAWHLPILSRMQRDAALGDVFEYVGEATRAGLPLPAALQGSLALRMNYHVRGSLMHWREQLMGGRSPAEAARDAHMPAFLVGLLESSESSRGNVGNAGIAEMFDFLSRYYRQRFSRLLIAVRAAAEPVAVVAVGTVVGLFVYAMYSPLVALILANAPGVSGNGVL